MKAKLALLLAFLMLCVAFASCTTNDRPGTGTTQTPGTNGDVTDAETEPDPLADLDFDGHKLTIAVRGTWYEYAEGDEKGDVIFSSIYDANVAVDEKLNITREYVRGDIASDKYLENVMTAYLASDNPYDVVIVDQYYGTSYASSNCFINFSDPQNTGYLDLSQSYWYSDYMDQVNVGSNTTYFLGGDLSPNIFTWSACTFFNYKMFGDLIGGGDANMMFDIVEAGEWTIDKQVEYIKMAFEDLDNDGVTSLRDGRIGLAYSIGQSAVFTAQAAGMQFSRKLDDGTFELCATEERNVDIFNKVYNLYNNTPGVYLYDLAKQDDGHYSYTAFSQSKALFMNEYLLVAWENKIREMSDPYAIIPRPKADEQQESYKTPMQDPLYLYTCLNDISPETLEVVTAFFEAQCRENSKTVFPEIYDTALKVKYVSDEVDSEAASRMIDLIYNTMFADFAVVYDKALSRYADTVGHMIEGRYDGFASHYAGLQSTAEYALEELMLSFMN